MGVVGAGYGVTYGFRVLFLINTGQRWVKLVGRGVHHRWGEVEGGSRVGVIDILWQFVLGLYRA